jgi:NRPS condensation-like uncharacterized protein
MDDVADLLESVRRKGVHVWSESGQLRYRAPKGALTEQEIQRLRASKAAMIALLLRAPSDPDARRESPLAITRAPLAFSQLAHWNAYRLFEQPSVRQVACALRLRGRLDFEALRHSIGELMRRHVALRTRILMFGGAPVQEICEPGDPPLELIDLTVVPATLRAVQVSHSIDELMLRPVDVASDPLFAARLVRLSADEHVLVLALEHMIADGFSLGVLTRDLFAIYVAAVLRVPPSLPPIHTQFIEYSALQRREHNAWLRAHESYWRERFAGCDRLAFPEDASPQERTRIGRATVPFSIDSETKLALREWCRQRRTTMALAVFTAYVALVLRWCRARQSVFLFQSDGRYPAVENAIGYFAAPLYLRIELQDDDTFVDLLEQVTREYCSAYEHADFSYFASQVPRLELTRNTAFNWLPSGSQVDLSALESTEHALSCAEIPFQNPLLRKFRVDTEPATILFESEHDVSADIAFPVHRFSITRMQIFAQQLLAFVQAMLRHPDGRVTRALLQ